MSTGHVVVVGGGLAGLQAAVACADAGARVTLLESRARLGGATWSRRHRGLGFEIDNGQHVFMRCCETYLAFLERLGVRDRVFLQERLAVPVARPGAGLDWIRRSRLPAPAHLASSLLRYRPLPVGARLRAGLTARAFTALDPDDPSLDRLSVGSWLRAKGETAASIERFWDVLIRATLNLAARDASLALATKVLRTGFLDRADGADIGWSTVPLAELHAAPARRLLERLGARVHCRAAVDAIEAHGLRGPAVRTRGERIEADAVILAAPHDAAADLLGGPAPETSEAAAALGRSPILNLHVVFDREVMALPFVAGVDSQLQWIFDRTRSAGLDRGQYLTVSLSDAAAYAGRSVSELRRLFEPELHALLPGTRAARISDFAVTSEPAATFRQAAGTGALRPAAGAAVADGVFLAGAWTATGWPATMEGAVRSGRAAAARALRSLGRCVPVAATEAA
jgi:squalene-associated FAD-dependent desaturase